MMDYLCGKFDKCIVSAVLVLSCGQTDGRTQTHIQTDADERFTPATLVGVSIGLY